MSKLSILNLLLFLVVVTLASVIYFSETQQTQLDRLSDMNVDHITAISVRHNDSITSLVKQRDRWSITQPIAIAANEFRINTILKLVNAPVHGQYTVDEIDLDKAGLSDAATSIQFDDQIISFGIINPATNLRYVTLNEDIYTIEDVYYPLLSSHFGTLVSLNLLPANSKIEKLVLANQTIAKDDAGLWQSNIDIDADKVIDIIQTWQQQQAFGIHEYMRRDTIADVFVYLQGQAKPVSYIVTDTDPWLILARPEIGLEYHLNIEAYNSLIAPE